MSDLMLHGLGRGSGDPGAGSTPIEGLTPIIVSDQIKGIGLTFAQSTLKILTQLRGMDSYHDGKIFVLHSLGVTVYDAISGEVIADNPCTTSSAAYMAPNLTATDGSYYLVLDDKLYKYALDGNLIWQKQTKENDRAKCIAQDDYGIYLGITNQSSYYVRKFNHTSANETWSSPSLGGEVRALAVNNNTVIVATQQDYLVKRLNPDTGAVVYSYTIPNNRYADALAIEPGTNLFYTVDSNRTLRKHSYQTGEPIFTFNNANKNNPFKLLIDSANNIYTISNQEITKLDNQLTDFIWREDYPPTSRGYFYGVGFNKEQGKLYVLHQYLVFILSATEKQWSNFIPHQFEGTVYWVDVDANGNFYGAGNDWTVRKFNALGEEQWVYHHIRAVNFVKADRNGNVFIGDTSRYLVKLNSYGVEQWTCNLSSGTTGNVTDLMVKGDGEIIVSIAYWVTTETARKDYLVKIDPDGVLISKKEISASGLFRKIHRWDANTLLAPTGLYDIDTFLRRHHFSSAKAIFGVHEDFLYSVDGGNIQVLSKYSGGQAYTFEVEDVDIVNSYLRAVLGPDGSIYVLDRLKTLVKFSGTGEEVWRYQARENIADFKLDDEHNVFLATGFYIEKLTQTFSIKGYDKN